MPHPWGFYWQDNPHPVTWVARGGVVGTTIDRCITHTLPFAIFQPSTHLHTREEGTGERHTVIALYRPVRIGFRLEEQGQQRYRGKDRMTERSIKNSASERMTEQSIKNSASNEAVSDHTVTPKLYGHVYGHLDRRSHNLRLTICLVLTSRGVRMSSPAYRYSSTYAPPRPRICKFVRFRTSAECMSLHEHSLALLS